MTSIGRWWIAFVLLSACSVASQVEPAQVTSGAPSLYALRSVAHWQYDSTAPITSRIVPASSELLAYLEEDNKKWGIELIPRAPKDSRALEQDIEAALALMPPSVRRVVSRKLVALILVRDLGSSAYTESVLDDAGEPVGGFVVVDSEMLNKSANAWATWRESTVFEDDPAIDIAVHIAEPSEDDRVHALLFILLHEFGHVIAQGERFHPNFERGYKGWTPGDTPFHDLSWTAPNQGFQSRFDEQFKARRSIKFYAPEEHRLPESRALMLYRTLTETNFPSLYGATAPYDDWAESFATYVYQVMLQKPYRVEVRRSNKLITTFTSCWERQSCKEKGALIESFLRAHEPE